MDTVDFDEDGEEDGRTLDTCYSCQGTGREECHECGGRGEIEWDDEDDGGTWGDFCQLVFDD
jgi:hypothetical protein